MRVLIIGSGGREHALGWKVAQNPAIETVFIAPGNAGTALEAKLQNVNIGVEDVAGLVAFAQDNGIELTIVGPEAPLVIGVVDAFRAAGLPIFGPTQAAAQLEGSRRSPKIFWRVTTFQPPLMPTSLKLSLHWLMCVNKVHRSSSKPTVWPQAKA